MNTCNKCKEVKYCNAACKKKHRHKHKKACEKRVAELYDEQLFKDPPRREECPICFLLLPLDNNSQTFKSCCGKVICNGCIHAMDLSEGGGDLCPFCRLTWPSSPEEGSKRIKKHIDAGSGDAYYFLGCQYALGIHDIPQDIIKATELWLKAGELGAL